MSPALIGALVGLILTAASVAGNSARADTFSVALFPDALTALVMPIAMYFVIRSRARQRPADNARVIERFGWPVVWTASAVFAAGMIVQTIWRIGAPTAATMAITGASGGLVAAGLGWASLAVWSRLLTRARTD